MARIVAAWWPLAVSWLLMSAEPAALAAVVARLDNPNVHLAAYGSVAFPLIGILQAPVLTLLSLSTAISKDWDSFIKGRKLMFLTGGGLTVIYGIVIFTPLFDWIVRSVIGAPSEVIEPARSAMLIGLPWTFAVAYRRFHQGVMIRFEHSSAVTIGTMLRFVVDAIVLASAWMIKSLPGASVASLMMVAGVITEAIYVGLRVRPILNNELRVSPPVQRPMGLKEMWLFFLPLGMTPLLNQLIRPIGSAALSRMPNPLEALAIWPVISSFSFLIVTPGAAFNEVVIAMLDRPKARQNLRRFMTILMASQFILFLLVASTPLSSLWFSNVSGLSPHLSTLAAKAFLLLIPASLLTPLNSWLSGAIVHSRRSRSITEAMGIYLIAYTASLFLGRWLFSFSGIYIAVGSAMVASLAHNSFLWFRSKEAFQLLDQENLADRSI